MKKAILASVAIIALVGVVPLERAQAASVIVTFTQLSGVTGGNPAGTGVYRADLSSLGTIASITIADNSSTSAGSPGQFSGFDLDAIVISNTLITSASNVGSLAHTGSFNFATSVFAAGTQTGPTDLALFGTAGGHVNNAVSTLNSFDGDSTTAIPGAFGFVSLGVGGKLSINLTSAILAGSPLYLYIGEVGNNGEVAAGTISVSSDTVSAVPVPAALPLFASGLGMLGFATWRKKRKAGPAATG